MDVKGVGEGAAKAAAGIDPDWPSIQICWNEAAHGVALVWHRIRNPDFAVNLLRQGIDSIDRMRRDQEALARMQAVQQQAADQQLAKKLFVPKSN